MAVSDIILSPVKIYHAPVGEAAPADSVAYGAAWGGAWVDVGYTLTPLTVNFSRETYEVFVEQLTNPVKEQMVKETLMLETNLAEMTGANLGIAFDGSTVTDTPAGVGQVGKTEVEAGGQVAVSTYAWGFEGYYQNSAGTRFPVRFFVFIGSAVLNGQLQFAKNKEVGIPLQIKAKADTGKVIGKQLFKLQKVTAAAL